MPESVQLGGTNRFFRKDLQQALHREVVRVRMELRLHECDRELYLAYSSETDFFETTALHGFGQLQRREGVRACVVACRACECARMRVCVVGAVSYRSACACVGVVAPRGVGGVL